MLCLPFRTFETENLIHSKDEDPRFLSPSTKHRSNIGTNDELNSNLYSTVLFSSNQCMQTVVFSDTLRDAHLPFSFNLLSAIGMRWFLIRYPTEMTQVDQSSCRNLKKPACSGDFRVGSRRFSPLPTVSEPFSTGFLPPDSCRMFSDNAGHFPVGLQPDLSGTYRNR